MISSPESALNEASSFLRIAATRSPPLSSQVPPKKNSENRPSIILSNSVDFSSKPTTSVLSSQMFSNNRRSKFDKRTEISDLPDTGVHVDASEVCMTSGLINQNPFTSRIVDTIDNPIPLCLSNNVQNAIGMHVLPSLSAVNYINNTSLTFEKEIAPRSVFLNTENNINACRQVMNIAPDSTIERHVSERKFSDIARITQGASVIVPPKNLIAPVVNPMSSSEKILKDIAQEVCYASQKKNIETCMKFSKVCPKKNKKGVDYLLEKIESCNKKFCNTDSSGLTTTIANMEEKDTDSIRSISPEYGKRCPSNRDDDVVSPNFSNDDSNDTKQRRKRKLGKPVRLAKDLKLEQDAIESSKIMTSQLPSSFPTMEYSVKQNPDCTLQGSLLPTWSSEHAVPKGYNQTITGNNIAISASDNKNESPFKNYFSPKGETLFENKLESEENKNKCDHVSSYTDLKKKSINMRQYLSQVLPYNQCTRIRTRSESYINTLNGSRKDRSKSCSDVEDQLEHPPPKFNVSNNFVLNEVESQLEKMFAGIIEADQDSLKRKPSETEISVTASLADEQEAIFKKEKLNAETPSQSIFPNATDNENYTNAKKQTLPKSYPHTKNFTDCVEDLADTSMDVPRQDKQGQLAYSPSIRKPFTSKKKGKNNKTDSFRRMICDSINASHSRAKGPFVHITGSKNNFINAQIVNVPREEDEEKIKEKRKIIGSGLTGKSKRSFHKNNLDYRGKVCSTGLFNSTLSVRYDAYTSDVTWICVFCKKGPHFALLSNATSPHPNAIGAHNTPGTHTVPAGVLSDLFGPYLIGNNERDDNIMYPNLQSTGKEPKQEKKRKSSATYVGTADDLLLNASKRAKKVTNHASDFCTGMTIIDGDEQRWEVWVHEQCIVWTAGVCITGGRITGLQDAVWDAAKFVCNVCDLSGANIVCIKRGCKSVAHYCCAATTGWYLDANLYMPECNMHKENRMS